MTWPDATSSGSGATNGPSSGPLLLDRDAGRQHNPIWAVTVVTAGDSSSQRIVRVFACDDTQARRYVADALGLVAVAVWLADD